MTDDEFKDLTPEEQAQLAVEQPKLLEAWKNHEIIARGWITAWRRKKSVGEEAEEQANQIQKEVAAKIGSGEQGSLLTWCGFPTDMTRCSPFFPILANELGDRKYMRDFVITSANWGQIFYSGPQLSIYEEDALIVVLAMLEQVNENREITKLQNRKTYSYRGPALPLLRLLGYKRPGKDAYKRFISTLELLVHAGVKLEISSGKTKSGRKRSPKYIQIENILSSVFWDEEKKELSVVINPFFYETYLAGQVSLFDVAKRMRLNGSISKALYRFVQSHRSDAVFTGHFLTLADALNLDRDQPAFKTRQNLKKAINVLITQGILQKKSGFADQDIVKLVRASGTLPKKKTQKALNS